jgi:catechol-2,3-dioxygenase
MRATEANKPEERASEVVAVRLQRWWPSGCISLPCVRMLHVGLRVTDLERSLAFYSALGYAVLGGVPETEFGSLTMLQLPDDPFVSLELVHDPARPVKGRERR